jgi:hypothetical protein
MVAADFAIAFSQMMSVLQKHLVKKCQVFGTADVLLQCSLPAAGVQ